MRDPEKGSRPHRLPFSLNHPIFWPFGRATNASSARVCPIQSVPCRSQWVESVPIEALGGVGDTADSRQPTALPIVPALLLSSALELAVNAGAVETASAMTMATRLAVIGRQVKTARAQFRGQDRPLGSGERRTVASWASSGT